MPDPVVRNSPALYSVPLHFMQEYVCFAIVDLLKVPFYPLYTVSGRPF
jgi:hypothetical protein